ncbi:MAG: multicopper oxidase domain-containing protein [Wenzhouxiangellaceae bacterium]|nr:multicopper oxidase domain-containing protein [Wenzhouxiangellaceae bacterium]
MPRRRDVLKLGTVAGGLGAISSSALARGGVPESGLVFPDGFTPSIFERPSPPATPFKDPLYRMPVARPVNPNTLDPRPDPNRHQRYLDFPPVKFYKEVLREQRWRYHSDPPYNRGSWGYTMNGAMPGPTYHAYYGEAVFVRRVNELPAVGTGKVSFALPSTTMHLHNAHTASESDGIPTDFMNPGEFWDHHYANFPAGFDTREIMSTLWYHDHRLDFTAPNVYAGLSGFYLLFDELDSNNENDPNPNAFRLPSGEYDIPLIFHDVQYTQDGQAVFDFFAAGELPGIQEKEPGDSSIDIPYKGTDNITLFGMLGDKITVNRLIQPRLDVEARKYRFRLLNGGPSRFYDFYLRLERGGQVIDNHPGLKFYVLSNDGNLLPEPIVTEHVEVWVANRFDVIVDFSAFQPGDKVYLVNRMDMRRDGAGPTGRLLDEGELAMRFDVMPALAEDPSRIPDFMRELPEIDLSEVRRERLWVFDYDNGLWTVNGKLMDANRIDAKIEQGTAEIWTIRNAGNSWAHPIHSHFEEFQILEIDGRPVPDGDLKRSRKDIVELGPNQEIRFFGRWRDFFGTHVMHCHNVVHEDHEMMIQWRIVPPGDGD